MVTLGLGGDKGRGATLLRLPAPAPALCTDEEDGDDDDDKDDDDDDEIGTIFLFQPHGVVDLFALPSSSFSSPNTHLSALAI